MILTADTIAHTFSGLLAPHLIDPAAPAFWLWARSDRAIISVNPKIIRRIESVYNDSFTHHLSTALGGVRVVRANTRGVFFQVGYTPVPQVALESRPLDFSEQPGPLYLPIGATSSGPLWLSLFDMGSVLIGGSRRMGKTRFLHAWILTLLASGAADLWLFDGKNGLEFGRYDSNTYVHTITDLAEDIAALHQMADGRALLFQTVRATSALEYNERVNPEDRLRPVVLIIDEAALVPEDAQGALARLIAWSGAYGIYPVLATQRTGVSQVPAMTKTNLSTRISFRVPALADSRVILDRPGAEQLPATPGRLAMVWDGRLIVAQAYQVDLPGGPQITPRDISIACWIRDQQKGVVSIGRLMRGQDMSEWAARQMIEDWQGRGWLIGEGQKVARRLTSRLLALLPQSTSEISKISEFESTYDGETLPFYRHPNTPENSVSTETEEE